MGVKVVETLTCDVCTDVQLTREPDARLNFSPGDNLPDGWSVFYVILPAERVPLGERAEDLLNQGAALARGADAQDYFNKAARFMSVPFQATLVVCPACTKDLPLDPRLLAALERERKKQVEREQKMMSRPPMIGRVLPLPLLPPLPDRPPEVSARGDGASHEDVGKELGLSPTTPVNGYDQTCINALDRVLVIIAGTERDGYRAVKLHEERQQLEAEGMKPTILPFCPYCGSPDVVAFGQPCAKCLKERGNV